MFNRFFNRWFLASVFSLTFVLLIYLFLKGPVSLLFKKDNCIHVFAWTNMVDEKIVEQFQKETGINVLFSYYDDTSELFLKLYSTRGKGYDVVFTSDYIVPELIDIGLLKKLDKSKLNFIKKIDSAFWSNVYDSKNEYLIPYEWSIYGLGFNKFFFKDKLPEPSWNSIFKPPFPYEICMLDEARQAILLASKYLFGDVNKIDVTMAEEIKKLLIKQKPYVKVYKELLADYLVSSGSCPVVVATSSLIWKIMRYDKNISFVFPKEGSFILIEGAVIPKSSEKEQMVYKFLNYIYQDTIMKYHIEKYGILTANLDILNQMIIKYPDMARVIPSKEYIQNIMFFKNIISKKVLNQIWIDLMAT